MPILELIRRGDRYDGEIVAVEGKIVMAKRGKHYTYYVLVDREGYHIQVIDYQKRLSGKIVVAGRYYAPLHLLFDTGAPR